MREILSQPSGFNLYITKTSDNELHVIPSIDGSNVVVLDNSTKNDKNIQVKKGSGDKLNSVITISPEIDEINHKYDGVDISAQAENVIVIDGHDEKIQVEWQDANGQTQNSTFDITPNKPKQISIVDTDDSSGDSETAIEVPTGTLPIVIKNNMEANGYVKPIGSKDDFTHNISPQSTKVITAPFKFNNSNSRYFELEWGISDSLEYNPGNIYSSQKPTIVTLNDVNGKKYLSYI